MNKEHITQTALDMVAESGLINLSRQELCDRAGIPDGSFPHIMKCSFQDFVKQLKARHDDPNIYPVVKTRTNPQLRREQILNVAVELAREVGYLTMTRDAIAERAGVSMGLVTRYFETMGQLRRDVMRSAVRLGIPEIVAQGLVNNDSHARKASPELKHAAAQLLIKG